MRSGFGDGGCGLPHQCAHWLRNDSFLHGVWCMAGGRPQGSPLRITSKSLLRADVGIGPYGGETEIRPLSGGRGRTPPLRMRYKRCGAGRNPPVTASPCQPPLGKGARRTGMRIATASVRTGFAMTVFCKECDGTGRRRHWPLRKDRRPFAHEQGGGAPRPVGSFFGFYLFRSSKLSAVTMDWTLVHRGAKALARSS